MLLLLGALLLVPATATIAWSYSCCSSPALQNNNNASYTDGKQSCDRTS
jgi:hypothetical protein